MSPAAIDSRLAAIRDGDLMGKTVTMPGSLMSRLDQRSPSGRRSRERASDLAEHIDARPCGWLRRRSRRWDGRPLLFRPETHQQM